MAIVRLRVGTLLFLCLLPRAFGGHGPNLPLFAAMVCYFALCGTVFGWIYLFPSASRARRVFAAVLDIGTNTAFMYHLGEPGASFYMFSSLIIFAPGFRCGKAYLYNSLLHG